MSRARKSLLGAGVLCAVVAWGAPLRAQGRFVVVARDALAVVPGLTLVTIRDSVQEACYILFVIEDAPPAVTDRPGEPPTLPAAAAIRDAQLQQLSAEFERTQY